MFGAVAKAITLIVAWAALGVTPGFARSTAASSRCLTPSKSFVSEFKANVKKQYRAKLTTFRSVHSEGTFGPFPRSLTKGVYFVSVRVVGVGTATWAVSADSYAGKGGVIYGAQTVSRRISNYGVDVGLDVLKRWGIAPNADGFAESRACV